jgi:GT2 family glycosyltransferase
MPRPEEQWMSSPDLQAGEAESWTETPACAPRIAVLIPCYNEEVAIPRVVAAFRSALPEAVVYVYDNNSRDRTREAAAAAGAVVRREAQQGKGHVVRRMLADIEADVYVLVDGDDTYDASDAPTMIRMLLEDRLDMVTGVRVTDAQGAYRAGHRLGNRVLTGVVRFIFGNRITDMLSGYRVFSRRFAKSFPAMASGFETETEFTVHALELRMPVDELRTQYRERPAGSESRLPHPERDRLAGAPGTAAGLLRLRRAAAGAGLHRARGAAGADLAGDRPGSTLADGGALDRPDAALLPLARMRDDPGHGHAGADGGEAPRLPVDSGAGLPAAAKVSGMVAEITRIVPGAEHIAGARAPARPVDADVIILAMDRPEETIAAIASARAQTGLAKHIWITDQGSRPDALARIAEAVRDAPDVTLMRLERNHGVAGGRNRATALGSARVVFALDNDAEFATRDTLARAVAALDAEPDVGAIACRILIHSTGEDDLSSWGYPLSLLPRAGESFDAATFVGAGHALRRSDFEAAGGYDDVLFFTWEEFDLALRLINMGRRIEYRGDIAVLHKVSPEHRFGWNGTRWHHFVRNRLYVALKHGAHPAALLPRFLAYQVRGARNGVLAQGLRAGPAALSMARRFRPPPGTAHLYGATPAARAYLARTDAAHRGGPLKRLRGEVLGLLPASR